MIKKISFNNELSNKKYKFHNSKTYISNFFSNVISSKRLVNAG